MGLPSGTFQKSYAQDMAIFRTRLHWVMLLGFLALLFTIPLFASEKILALLILIGVTIISVQGLNILTGYCGQISLGHAAFMAVGAYTSGILCTQLGWSFWAALPCAALTAGMVGIVFGLPSLKIKGFYLIMATVAAQFIIIWIILQMYQVTGGADGLPVPRPRLGNMVIASEQSSYYLIMTFACLATFLTKNLTRTKVGRAFVAIRDNDLAAEVMGVNLLSYKLQAFFIGCAFAGLAGSLWVHYIGLANVEQFTLMNSIWYLGMLIIGGMGSTMGVIFGVVFFKLLDELIIIAAPLLSSAFPAIAAQVSSSLALILYALVILLFLIFEPRGLAHRWTIVKAYYRLWPFSH